MKYIIAIFWSFLLVTMLNYVVGSIVGVDFDFQTGAIVSVVLAILVIILAESLPSGEVADH